MLQMGFVDESSEQDLQLSKDFWAELAPHPDVTFDTLKIYLAALQNIHFDWMDPRLSVKETADLSFKYR